MPAKPVQRRAVLASLGTAALALSGCGFELRRAPEFAFSSLLARFTEGSPLGAEFQRAMATDGKVQVTTDARQQDQVQVLLDVLTDQREKAVVGQGATGQVREFQLRLRLRFRLRSSDGRELIPETEILQQREISYNESIALAKEAEQEILYRDMQSEVVLQLMRRLAAVKKI